MSEMEVENADKRAESQTNVAQQMAQTTDQEAVAQDTYNQTAIKIAQSIFDARVAARKAGHRVMLHDAEDSASSANTAVPTIIPDTDTLSEMAQKLDALFPSRNRAGVGVALEYERMGNQPVSDALLERAEQLGVTFEHIGLTLGTVVRGLQVADAEPEMIAFLRAVLLERKVIFFREQILSENQQVEFGRKFGSLDAFPFGKPGKNPYILEIVHDEDHPGTENGWHTDVTWMRRPSLGSIAHCTEVPPYGGDTLFADSHAALLGLPPAIQERITKLRGVHDYRIFLHGLSAELVEEIKAAIPFGVDHPLVRIHPETGKPALYIHGGFLRHESLFDIRDGTPIDSAESEQIVRALLTQHERAEYGCRFKWAPGSIAFWDNRACQHYAASDYYPHRRVLRRVTLSGDEPQ